jgi:CheY-like chemotaxis protein
MSKRILVVEDDAAIREVLTEILELDGYQVDAASNGEEGLQSLSKKPLPHLILLDLMMPVKDGFAFRSEQLANPQWSKIPVIVLSANANLETRINQLSDHKLPFLKKPVDLDVMLGSVKSALKEGH